MNNNVLQNLRDQQEINLHQNWKQRCALGDVLTIVNGVHVIRCSLDGGRVIFYAVREGVPLGYVSCLHDSRWEILIVVSTYFSPEHQRQGLGTLVYETIIDTHGHLNSDYELTEGARALWRKLMRNNKITVGPGLEEGSYRAIKNR